MSGLWTLVEHAYLEGYEDGLSGSFAAQDGWGGSRARAALATLPWVQVPEQTLACVVDHLVGRLAQHRRYQVANADSAEGRKYYGELVVGYEALLDLLGYRLVDGKAALK